MLDIIISDIEKALDAEAYLSALALMMTIPDICAKAEYGDTLKNHERYIKWFEENIGQYNRTVTREGETEMPYFSGEVAYQLRCSVLHEGHPGVDKTRIKNDANQIDCFVLAVETRKPFEIYIDSSSITTSTDGKVKGRSYEVNIRRLWGQIKSVSEEFFKNNKDKFAFLSFKVLDVDKRLEAMKKLDRG